MTDASFVRALLGDDAWRPTVASAAELRAHAASCETTDTVERAALGGRAASCLGWAFASGYEAALRRLLPSLREGELAALCASEEGGAHPRNIRTKLVPRDGGWILGGRKSWVTLGADASVLLVVASTGADPQGRNQLRVARVPSSRAGVSLEPAAALPFAPEIGHARVTFSDVAVAHAELLDGDGYDEVLKPFRTIEDVHVLAAAIGWAIAVARASAWERAWLERALAVVVALRGVASAPPSQAETHVVLAGATGLARRLLEEGAWEHAAADVRDGWQRDRALLDVAGTARQARAETAWRKLASPA
jgi:acyl-CoA dehydrogenase